MPTEPHPDCPYCQKAYKITVTQHENPLTDPEAPENFAGTPIYDELRKKFDLQDGFFTLVEKDSPKNV